MTNSRLAGRSQKNMTGGSGRPRRRITVRSILALLVIACSAMAPSAARSQSSVIYSVDFSGFPGGSVLKWLGSRGFVAKQDAGNSKKVVYSVARDTLRLETKTRAFGLLLNEANVRDYSRIRIEWGVDVFPPGASYEKGIRSEAIMVYVFFGKERHASGSLFIPDSPYFIGLFLCESEATNKPFTGRYHRASGRFVCVDRPSPGTSVTTDFPIAEAFTRIFGKNQAPDISGIGIAIDTANVRGTGIAKSFIRKIEFLK
ncbi:MAG TPA: hypothetical protein VLX09_06050 [Stellaceae bacterium]|nr:hypothetical protein [Stellaceae bacterium]